MSFLPNPCDWSVAATWCQLDWGSTWRQGFRRFPQSAWQVSMGRCNPTIHCFAEWLNGSTRVMPGGFQNYSRRIYWQTLSIKSVGESNYGDLDGPELIEVDFTGDNMPTWVAFDLRGALVGLGALIDSSEQTASILGPQAVRAVLRSSGEIAGLRPERNAVCLVGVEPCGGWGAA